MKFISFEPRWNRISSWFIIGAIGAAVGLAQTVAVPVKNGSIQGAVVGADGTPLPGARIYAAVTASSQKTKAPPILMNYVQAGAIAQSTAKSPASTFLISGLPAGTYVLCAQSPTPGWLDPCHWSTSVPAVTLAAGQNLTGQTVVMTKGAVVQIRLVDPSRLLSANPGPVPKDVEVIAKGSNNAWYNAQLSATDATGQYRQVTLPIGQLHTLIVRSRQFSLLDSTGAAVPATGKTQPLQIASSASVPQFTYTVAGKAH